METRIADRHGDVEGSSVERDVENQSKLPLDQRIPRLVSWRFGNLVKSKN